MVKRYAVLLHPSSSAATRAWFQPRLLIPDVL
jgi:hypothetical protein